MDGPLLTNVAGRRLFLFGG